MPCDTLSDPAAERAVLAGVFRYGLDCFVDVDDLVTHRTFTVDSNQAIYRCLRHLFERDPEAKPDVPTVLAAAHSLGLDGLLSDPEEKKHLRAVTQMPVERTNVRKLAVKVRKLEIARAGVEVASVVRDGLAGVTGDEPLPAIVNLLEGPVLDFASSLTRDAEDEPALLGDGLEAWVEHLAANPVEQVGLKTGMRHFDAAIGGGMTDGSITLVGARSGEGKTMVGISCSLNAAAGAGYDWPLFDVEPRVPVLYLDTEMGKEDHRLRSLSALAGVHMNDVKTGRFGADAQWGPAVRGAAGRLRDLPYFVKSIAGQPFEETLSLMRRWVVRHVGLRPDGKANRCLIVFDYVKLMDAGVLSKNLQEFQALGFVMTGLHNFAVRYGLPILAFCQLNRDGIHEEDTNAIGGSDRLLWLCSTFALYKRQSKDEMDAQTGNARKWNFKLLPLKTRHGPGLKRGDYVNVLADYARARVAEGPLQSEADAADPRQGFRQEGGDGGGVSFAD